MYTAGHLGSIFGAVLLFCAKLVGNDLVEVHPLVMCGRSHICVAIIVVVVVSPLSVLGHVRGSATTE